MHNRGGPPSACAVREHRVGSIDEALKQAALRGQRLDELRGVGLQDRGEVEGRDAGRGDGMQGAQRRAEFCQALRMAQVSSAPYGPRHVAHDHEALAEICVDQLRRNAATRRGAMQLHFARVVRAERGAGCIVQAQDEAACASVEAEALVDRSTR